MVRIGFLNKLDHRPYAWANPLGAQNGKATMTQSSWQAEAGQHHIAMVFFGNLNHARQVITSGFCGRTT